MTTSKKNTVLFVLIAIVLVAVGYKANLLGSVSDNGPSGDDSMYVGEMDDYVATPDVPVVERCVCRCYDHNDIDEDNDLDELLCPRPPVDDECKDENMGVPNMPDNEEDCEAYTESCEAYTIDSNKKGFGVTACTWTLTAHPEEEVK